MIKIFIESGVNDAKKHEKETTNEQDFIMKVIAKHFPKCKYVKPDKDLKDIAVGEKTDKICPKCGSPLLKKKGKYGYFLGCSNYPNCNYMEKFKKRK